MNGGTALTSVHQFDVGLFANDDWRIKPNLTIGYGVRYETQTNIHDWSDLSPRISVAWGIGGQKAGGAKTILRAGYGTFYDRIAYTDTLNSDRYNGVTQQSYLVMNPDTNPLIPTLGQLSVDKQSQDLMSLDRKIIAPRTYQGSLGIDRQVNRWLRLSAQYIASRGVHLERTRNANAPVDGVLPYGDQTVRLAAGSPGLSRTNQLVVTPNIRYKRLFLFGFYALSFGKTNAEGSPSDPSNLKADWGPSTYADIRHRFVTGTMLPMPYGVSLSPFILVSSGSPFNITTGRDSNGDSFVTERPALVAGATASSCTGADSVYESRFGCFNLQPAQGTKTIGYNYGRGPSQFTLNLRLAKTLSFGGRKKSENDDFGPPPGMGGVRGGGGPPGGPGGGPLPGGGGPGGGGPPSGMFGRASGKRYSMTFSSMASNVLNHPNYAAPDGNLSSPYFGESRSLASFGPFGSSSTYNRKIDLQVRFQF